MKRGKFRICVLCLLVTALALISLGSCAPQQMDIGSNTELGTQFMDCMIGNNYDAAYDLVKETVSPTDFSAYWATVQPIVQGAASYELEQIGWYVNMTNGTVSRTTAYQVYLDNGNIAFLRVITYDGIEGIAGLYVSDVTAFITAADATVPVLKAVFAVISVLSIAFCIWMLVDCLRRKIKYKVLWAIAIFVGVAFTVTVGATAGFRFMIGLMLQANTVAADPSIQSIMVKIVLPVGAIVYCCLRKRLTVVPAAEPQMTESSEFLTADEPPKAEDPSAEDDRT